MRILIPIDASELSLRAVEHVARFAHQGEVVLLHVAVVPPELLEHRGSGKAEQERELEHEVGEAARSFREQIRPEIECEVFGPAKDRLTRGRKPGDLSVQTLLVTEASSDPALTIIEVAGQGGYDAVVIGRHGRSGIMRFVLGGTASKLVHHLQTTPIWLVP
jgi:nucleotide-binding universal stress UspA family protein